MNFVMAAPVWGRNARLTEAFIEVASWLHKKNVVYALLRYRIVVTAAMHPQRNWISFETENWLIEMKRWSSIEVFAALAKQFWMPENVRRMGENPAKSLRELFVNC